MDACWEGVPFTVGRLPETYVTHTSTHFGGKREDLYVNISHRQHSTPLLLYSTLSAVCVPLTVPVCSFHHLHSFSQPHRLTAPPPPSNEPPSLPLPIDLQILGLIFATDVVAINDGTPQTLALLSLDRLPALVHSPCLVIYLAVLQSSVQISLSRGRCNVIFCLSPSGYARYCCYSRSLGLS